MLVVPSERAIRGDYGSSMRAVHRSDANRGRQPAAACGRSADSRGMDPCQLRMRRRSAPGTLGSIIEFTRGASSKRGRRAHLTLTKEFDHGHTPRPPCRP